MLKLKCPDCNQLLDEIIRCNHILKCGYVNTNDLFSVDFKKNPDIWTEHGRTELQCPKCEFRGTLGDFETVIE